LWTIVSFADDAARDQWANSVRAAFRLLADSGFGGERSRGWGRAESPEFIEGRLPGMVLPAKLRAKAAVIEAAAEAALAALVEEGSAEPVVDVAVAPASEEAAPLESTPVELEDVATTVEAIAPTIEEAAVHAEPAAPELIASQPVAPPPSTPQTGGAQPYWMLSLFAPAASDTVDWARGDYSVLERNGRIDSPVASGGLKKQVNLVAEGSVLFAASAPQGSAPDVAPDGFPHPVFRAGFAVAIPLTGEVS
jgi:hypothetical protein